MNVYIDSDYRCHTEKTEEASREFDVDFFNGKCKELIESRRYIPVNESWTRSDGEEFDGEAIFPWKDDPEIEEIQHAYELSRLADAEKACEILLGGSL